MKNQCYMCQQNFETKEKLYDHLDVHAGLKTEPKVQEPKAPEPEPEPKVQEPKAPEPRVKESKVQELSVQKLTVQELIVQKFTAQELTVQEPIEIEPIAPEPKAQEPTIKKKGNPAICTDCGTETLVPFKPKEGLPVYCKGCLMLHSSEKLKKLSENLVGNN